MRHVVRNHALLLCSAITFFRILIGLWASFDPKTTMNYRNPLAVLLELELLVKKHQLSLSCSEYTVQCSRINDVIVRLKKTFG